MSWCYRQMKNWRIWKFYDKRKISAWTRQNTDRPIDYSETNTKYENELRNKKQLKKNVNYEIAQKLL